MKNHVNIWLTSLLWKIMNLIKDNYLRLNDFNLKYDQGKAFEQQ